MDRRPQATATVQIDNERVTVTEWRFAPGAQTGWHRHNFDYVVVPQTSGKLSLEAKEGVNTADLQAGKSYFRQVGVEHNVINANDYEFAFVEIELKP
jgi:quercetin dioxygenase-like cupin family protein